MVKTLVLLGFSTGGFWLVDLALAFVFFLQMCIIVNNSACAEGSGMKLP